MNELGRFFEGQPDIRTNFENELVIASDNEIERLTPMQVLALRIGDRRTISPSEIDEYPQVLYSFIKRDGIFNGERVTPSVVGPLIATLTDVVLAFYRKHLYAIMTPMLESGAMATATRETVSKCLEKEIFGQAFKTSVAEVLGRNLYKVIESLVVTGLTSILGVITAGLLFGTNSALFTFGIGAAAAAAVVVYHAVTFKGKFKERVLIEVRDSSHVIYDDLNQRLYTLLKGTRGEAAE